ncbi:uncharacterized protein TOT_040000381 [Theileria orientalis strain Shintoku]|uniref:Uncharacterized protein n=1 Tax=Theileria orientalis strain Shintoku TaxID=869250 RepID=J4CDZ5_THEOR|nr:uncharacterized protein TOT_040000381 [Theileria orientalis strain Shintoku]BAM42002.1 uncharacterized protein TOT_040000381 [Theileria orientalis strain Shintoku]|eukprot:XP_009692303.1 uncharacterized protein TOT_040000381 [Theileria orientalis strain Shintoku]
MSTWSSYSEYFYRKLVENDDFKIINRKPNNYTFKNIIDSSCSNISSYRNVPKSSDNYKDYLFSIPDSTHDCTNFNQNNKYINCKLNCNKEIYKSQGNQTSRKIHSLYFTSGNKLNSIYSNPYEYSSYTNINLSQYDTKATSRANVYNYLSREIVNSIDTLTLYDNVSKNEHMNVVLIPSGVVNSGIKGLRISPKLKDEQVYVEVNEVFNVYPSCFFSYLENCSNYYMEPFVESNDYNKIETSWDAYTLKSYIYGINTKFKTVNDDLDILEIISEKKSIYSSTIYSRNSLGIFVFSYYFDGEWKIKPINNVSYKHENKVYYISVSPYLSDESVFLTTNNELLFYDGYKGHERDSITLSSLIKHDEDVVQTVCYGMDNNNLILAGSQLYSLDKREGSLSPFILHTKPPMTITSTTWTERNYDLEYPSRHYNMFLSGRYCSYSSYHRKSGFSFSKSFTALATHPLHNYILASVCGSSNSILIFDLRIPNSPIIDIPLPSAELIGSRFRSIKWHIEGEYSLLLVFSWRQKYPICLRFKIDTFFTNYSIVSDNGYHFKDFIDCDIGYDTSLMFDRTIYFNFSNTHGSQDDNDFDSCGPLIETQKTNFEHQINLTKDSTMSNIFHGYLGMTMITSDSINSNLLMMLTTSGRLLCMDMNARNIILNRKNQKRLLDTSEVDLLNESDAFVGIDISLSNKIGIPVPDYIKFDQKYKFVRIKKIKIHNHYSVFKSFGLQENIVKIQEQHFGDERLNSHISINNCHVNDFKNYTTQKFNSQEILKRILSYNKIDNYYGPILSLSRFIELYGTEHTLTHNVWNPLNNKLDHEYETELKNPFFKETLLCSCSSLKESIFDKYSKMFQSILNFVFDDVNEVIANSYNNRIDYYINSLNTTLSNIINFNRQNNKSTLYDTDDDHDNNISLPSVSAHGVQDLLINNIKENKSLIVDKCVASTFGDMLLFQSNLNNYNGYEVAISDENREHESDDINVKDSLHRHDCTMNDVLCVDASKDSDDTDSLNIVDQLLSSWVIEHRELAKSDTHSHANRVFIPGDAVEHLTQHKMKQKRLISQILTSMDVKP